MTEPSDFATTILTSKLPQEVANFIPHSLDLSRTLLDKHLAVWFSNYVKMLIKFNQDLNLLVANGKDFFTLAGGEFGSIDRVWNCLASSVTAQIGVNDSLIKTIRHDILSQLGSVKEDVSFTELVVNSNELTEISQALSRGDSNGEYQWNVKAPAVLSNFENYKRHEKSTLLNCFMSYLNAVNTRNSSMLQKNEKAVNYILKEFNLEREMNAYAGYMVNTNVEAPAHSLAPTPQPQKPVQRNAGTRASVASSEAPADKKKLKLRSKVGSLLGRNKKKNQKQESSIDAIPEDHSYSSNTPSRRTSFSTRRSFQDHAAPTRQKSHRETPTLAPAPSAPSASYSSPGPNTAPAASHSHLGAAGVGAAGVGAAGVAAGAYGAHAHQNGSASQNASTPQTLENTVPLQPAVAQKEAKPEPHRETKPDFSLELNQDPNVVKYSSSSESDEAPTDALGNRLSMLQTHDLDNKEQNLRPREASSGKYSFEYGDEHNSFSALNTPKVDNPDTFPSFGRDAQLDQTNQQQDHFSSVSSSPAIPPGPVQASSLPQAGNYLSATPRDSARAGPSGPAPDSDLPGAPPGPPPGAQRAPSSGSLQKRMSGINQAPHGVAHPPPPPPSRKVNPHVPEHTARRDIHSQTFHNLPNARELFIQPRALDDQAGTRTSLVSQTTGNSLFKQPDYFKHFGSSQALVTEGLNASVAEILNVTFQNETVLKSQILGEIAFNYNTPTPSGEPIPVHIPASFSRYLLNEKFMRQNGEGSFLVDLNPITSRTLGGLKYTLDLKPEQVPVIVKQIWKFEPHQASLIIKLSLNPHYGQLIQLDGLIISASLDHNVASTTASSKPEGTFNKDRNRITWRIAKPVVLDSQGGEEKLIARIMTNGQAREAPSGIQVKFNVHDPAVLYVPILDAQQRAIPSVRSLTSGSYSSHS